jgi:diguanylate cyclase (GGDEF)-like protein
MNIEYHLQLIRDVVMLKRISKQFLVDLGELEGDYRVFHLKDDIAHSTLYMSIAILSVLGMIRMDVLLYKSRPNLVLWLLLYRGGYILLTILTILVLRKTNKVRIFDRVMLAWMAITVFFLLVFNLTRPASAFNVAFDVIVPFAIYIFSPLKMVYNIALTVSFSAGTLYVDYFHKSGIDPFTLNSALIAQLTAHALGLVSGLQIQSYRRKSFSAYMKEKDAREMVAYLANIDPLTKSLTRRQFFNIAESEFLRFLRYRRQLSVLVLDADHFKKINDSYGHHAGDLVLRSLSLVILEQKRAQDTFGRLGGEEFGLLLPETSLGQAKVVAERIQKIWERTPCIVDDDTIYSTVSIGVAEVEQSDTSFEDILRRADRMMYKAKEAGRNTVAAE